MKLAFIAPVKQAHLMEMGDIIYILPQLLKYQEYRNVVEKSNKLKILDNGAYELHKPIDGFEKIVEEIQPDVVVIPDVPDDFHRTLRLIEENLDKFSSYDRMCVVQMMPSTKLKLVQSFYASLDCEYLGFCTFFWLRDLARNYERERLFLSHYRELLIHTFDVGMKVHLLGINFPSELTNAWIHSCDTTLPFTAAKHRKKLTPFGEIPTVRLDLANEVVNETYALANIRFLKEVAK